VQLRSMLPTKPLLKGLDPSGLCWHRGRYFLLEAKSGSSRPNQAQAEFMARCPGEIHVARTADEAVIAAVGPEAMK
jgi:hypothetical protein